MAGRRGIESQRNRGDLTCAKPVAAPTAPGQRFQLNRKPQDRPPANSTTLRLSTRTRTLIVTLTVTTLTITRTGASVVQLTHTRTAMNLTLTPPTRTTKR